MKRVFLVLSVVALLVSATGCRRADRAGFDQEGNLYGQISISGAWAMYPLTVRWIEEFRKEHPNVRIDVSAGGAGKGMADVLSGMVHLAMVSREITQAEVDQNAVYFSVAKDAVVPTFSLNNPNRNLILTQGLTLNDFRQIFLEDSRKTWNTFIQGASNDPINIYTRSDASGAAETWAQYLGMSQEDLRGVGVFGDPGIADIVRNDMFGAGFNNIAFAFDITTGRPFEGLGIIPIDLNENGTIDPEEQFYENLDQMMHAIATGKYPSPPSRNLYFVSYGNPTNVAVVEFLRWVLQKGQDFTKETGFVSITSEVGGQELQRLPETPGN